MLSSPAVASLQTFPKPFSFLYDSVNLSGCDLFGRRSSRFYGLLVESGKPSSSDVGLPLYELAGRGSAWQGWVQGLVGQAGRGLAGLGWAGDEIRTKLRPVLKPERQLKDSGSKPVGLRTSSKDACGVVEKASF
ncbi:hypothetical protein BY996DRAFT_8400660, partial [Phakopsora pachyrhizi]